MTTLIYPCQGWWLYGLK